MIEPNDNELPVFGKGSSVILVSSLDSRAVSGNPGQPGSHSLPVYAATKGQSTHLVKHWASSLAGRGIRVNVVAPGVIATEMSSFTKTEDDREFVLGMQALKRIGQADVADVIAFLASNKVRWITGVNSARRWRIKVLNALILKPFIVCIQPFKVGSLEILFRLGEQYNEDLFTFVSNDRL